MAGNLPRKRKPRRRNPANEAYRQIEDLKNSLLDHGMTIMDELSERLFTNLLDRFLPSTTSSPAKPSSGSSGRRSTSKPPQIKTAYDLLEVSPYASMETIEAAWKSLCKRHHPDKGGNGDYIKLINQAHDVLSDSLKRADYDRRIGLR